MFDHSDADSNRRQAITRPTRIMSSLFIPCMVAAVVTSGCGPVYTASQTFTLARDLDSRPLDLEFNLRGLHVRVETDGLIVEGIIAEVDPEAVRIGAAWYPLERMRDPGDNYIRNKLTGVGVLTRFIDAESGELIDRFIDANRIRRFRIGDQWYETSDVRFLDSPRFDDPVLWVDKRVRLTTLKGRVHEGILVPIDTETFSVNGNVFTVTELADFATVTRCFECEAGRGFLIMAIAPFAVIALLVATGALLALRLVKSRRDR